MKSRKRGKVLFLLILICVAAGMGMLFYSYSTRVYKHCMAEAGTAVAAEDFLKDPSGQAAFTQDGFPVDVSVPGDYDVTLRSGIFTYHCILTIQDTIAPVAKVNSVETSFGEEKLPEDFVTDITDATKVTVSYKETPDFNAYGTRPVTILLTDLGGNQTAYETTLLIRPVKESVQMEVGSEVPPLSDFLYDKNAKDAQFMSNLQNFDSGVLTEKEVLIRADGEEFTSILQVVDTSPPTITVQVLNAYTTSVLTAEQFVTESADATALTFSFAEEPDMTYVGEQTVTIVATDEGGNSTRAETILTLAEDTEAPIIRGVCNKLVYIGDGISYKSGVTVTDNCDGDIALQVDNSQVDLNTEGDYPVTYSAKDRAGNETVVDAVLSVRKHAYTQEEIDALADQVLADIITPDMSEYDKLTAIYNWVRSHVSYINYSEKGDWIRGAYEGLALRQGDCYVYFATSKELLTRTGIANRDIEKIPTRSQHFWNLVNIGEGWYHFDTCPRKEDHPNFCYVDDATLMAYSDAHYRSHNYDRSIYTDIE